MKTLENIWGDLKAGDIVLKQKVISEDMYDKTQLVVIVGLDVWDMAMVVYYTDYKDFNSIAEIEKQPKVYSFAEWMEYRNVLGHWHKMPTFKQLLKAKRKEIV